jgi:uncharacterized protein YbcI
LNAALAKAVVASHRHHVGRGPTKAQAFFRDRHVVVIMEDAMTRAEHSLLTAGHGEAVLDARRLFQSTMRDEMVEAVERLTGAKVVAFMSANHLEPDLACEVFVMDRPVGAIAP